MNHNRRLVVTAAALLMLLPMAAGAEASRGEPIEAADRQPGGIDPSVGRQTNNERGAAIRPDAQTAVDEHRRSGDLPGVSAAIALDGELVYAAGAGVADLVTGRPMSADTPFYAGSLSKVFTAALVLALVEDDTLTLDSRPAIGGAVDAATARNLLTHSSGLPREGNFDYWFTGRFPGTEDLDAYLRGVALRNEPGAGTRYSNIGYATLGRMLEDATGRPYAELLADRLLAPLGLTATGAERVPGNLARGYTPAGRLLPSAERPFAGVGDPVDDAGDSSSGNRHLREYHDAEAMTPAFGIVSSASDLARAGAFLVGERDEATLSLAGRRLMLSAQRANRSFGLRIGTIDGRRVARHGGWFAAHRSHLILDDDADIAVVVLTNSDDGNPEALAETLYSVALEAVDGASAGSAESAAERADP